MISFFTISTKANSKNVDFQFIFFAIKVILPPQVGAKLKQSHVCRA
jgi:hypothetical protein